MDVRDRVKTLNDGSAQTNLTYGDRIPNQPYLFANTDLSLTWHNCGVKGNVLTFAYDNYYQKEFPLYSESLGSKESKNFVPEQFSHNISLTYTLECRSLTDAKLYDNFSLQKAGRAFYGKVRVCLGGKGMGNGHNGEHRKGGRGHRH